ncbi:M3 family oligoendopeptidase [Neomegalonema perideroedes]|uniref:M3 family oligoendopeptidase n=1 Tax=Neomegalonema perideroedes TaxID=217219 RepID=UPI00036CDC70|nr:M3 family oligoendopeptidase [Neomegalonema perideroedes]
MRDPVFGPLFDSAEAVSGRRELGPLPEWDLTDLYSSPDCAEIKRDFERVQAENAAFAADYQEKVAGLSGDGLARAISRYEDTGETMGRIGSFAGLRYYADTTDSAKAKFLADSQARLAEASSLAVFFTLELNRIPDADLEAKYAESAALRRYKPWIEEVRAFRPYQLSDDLEKFLHDQSVAGDSAWGRLFDETMGDLRYEVGGESLTLEETLTLMSRADRAKRQAAGEALAKVFTKNLRLFALITNTLAKSKEVVDRWRKAPSPQTMRHLSNSVEPEVVQALRDSVTAAYPRVPHRYYALKAKWLGLDKLEFWDRNAPLPDRPERVIAWDEARETVLGAYGAFSPKMRDLAANFFEKPWIDAPARPGKSPGAFAHSTVPSAHPYVLVNYLGQTRDVMTLAHELGHGVHQILAGEQGPLMSSTPLTLAETASVFGEMLTFRALLDAETDPKTRKALLAGKVEDMINTVFRQIAFYEFESRVHAARREGELTPDDLNAIWLAVQTESLGPAFNFAPGYESFWVYIGHFIHSPFYVYAYAFGDGLVNALYGVYEERKAQGRAEEFVKDYFDLLAAGGSKRHKELLAPFGLDAGDPKFWSKGLDVISRMIDELEAME